YLARGKRGRRDSRRGGREPVEWPQPESHEVAAHEPGKHDPGEADEGEDHGEIAGGLLHLGQRVAHDDGRLPTAGACLRRGYAEGTELPDVDRVWRGGRACGSGQGGGRLAAEFVRGAGSVH